MINRAIQNLRLVVVGMIFVIEDKTWLVLKFSDSEVTAIDPQTKNVKVVSMGIFQMVLQTVDSICYPATMLN